MSAAFLVTTLIIVVTPGTGVLYTLAAGLARGRRAGVVAAFGCTLGILPHVVAAVLGLAALLYASSVAFQAVKLVGVVYLVVMAVATLRGRGALELADSAGERGSLHVVVQAVLVNVLNPKLSIFFVAFLPQFVHMGDPHRLESMLALSGVFMAVTFVVFVAYGLTAAGVRRHVLGRPRVLTWLRRTCAAAFLGLGVRLALAER